MAATSPAPMRAVGVAAAAFILAPLPSRLSRVSTVSSGRLLRCHAAHRWRPPRCRGKPAVGGVVEEEEEDEETSREASKPERKKEAEDTDRGVLGWFRLDEVGMDILGIAVPAALALAADPITALVDTAFVGHIGSVELAAVGVSISVFNLVSKLFNVPLLNVTTSFVAEQQAVDASSVGERDEAMNTGEQASEKRKFLPAVSTSLALAAGIGLMEMVGLIVGSGALMDIIGIPIWTAQMEHGGDGQARKVMLQNNFSCGKWAMSNDQRRFLFTS